MTKISDYTVKTWTSLVRAHRTALSLVENALKDAGLPALSWYDILLELDRAGEKGLRPFALERQLLLPQYGISRLIERIEKAGYLTRKNCQSDGRGQILVITPKGKTCRRQMWPIYGQAIEQAVGVKLTPAQAKNLTGLLTKIMD